jgi:uncharacterized protein YukE
MAGPNRQFNLWDPVGDSSALRRAAAAWRRMASSLRQLESTLGGRVSGSAGFWSGEAGDAFRAWYPAHLARPLRDEAAAMDGMAGQLEEAAAQIDRANAEIHELEIEIAATLVLGGLLAVVTAGASAAAAGAADAAMAARAAMVLDRLATILRVIATVLRGLFSSLFREYVESLVYNTLVTGAVKTIQNPDHNPLHGWSVWDALGIVVTSGIQAPVNVGVARLFNVVAAGRAGLSLTSEPWSAAKQAASPLSLGGLTIRPGWAATAIREGAESSLAGALTWGIRDGVENWSGFQHHSWAEIARDVAIGGTLNLIVGGVAGGLSGGRALAMLNHRGHVVLTKLVGRPLINGPTTAFISRPPQRSWLLGGPSALPLTGVHASPGLPAPVGGPPGLVTAGGGTRVVRPGDSLWAIAQRAYGDERLWPVLLRDNRGAIGDPNLIFTGQRFDVPPLPAEELRRLLQRLEARAA